MQKDVKTHVKYLKGHVFTSFSLLKADFSEWAIAFVVLNIRVDKILTRNIIVGKYYNALNCDQISLKNAKLFSLTNNYTDVDILLTRVWLFRK